MTNNLPVPLVSFVIIAYNEQERIASCIRAIRGQDAHVDYEVVVVDDGSSDGTAVEVQRASSGSPEVRLISLPRNCGRGNARKTGSDEARGRYLAYVDADIILPPNWLSRCLDEIASADAVGGIAVPDGDVAYIYRRLRLAPKPRPGTTEITGNNGLFRRELFDRVSFDPQLTEGEDIALNHALRASGARIVRIRDLFVRHEETKSFWRSIVWLFESGRGAARQLYRYRQVRLPDLVFGGFVGICGFSVFSNRRHARRWLLAPLYVLIGSSAHVSAAFEWDVRRPLHWCAALALDSVMLVSYFAGRAVGLVRFRHEAITRT